MTDQEIIELLQNAGYDSGWAVSNGELRVWDHEENPPAPLVRPIQETIQQ